MGCCRPAGSTPGGGGGSVGSLGGSRGLVGGVVTVRTEVSRGSVVVLGGSWSAVSPLLAGEICPSLPLLAPYPAVDVVSGGCCVSLGPEIPPRLEETAGLELSLL